MRIAVQDGVDIIGADFLVLHERHRVENEPRKAALIFARLGEQRHVGRRLAESRRGRLRIGIGFGRREDVGGNAGALEYLALVVRRVVGDLIGRSKRLDLPLAEAGAAGVGQRAERNAERVAGAADFVIDFEAALQLLLIIGPEKS